MSDNSPSGFARPWTPNEASRNVWCFGRFELDLDRAVLRSGLNEVVLRPKAFDLLAYFATKPRRLVSKQQLLDAVWPGVIVTNDSIVQCVSELRAAMGDEGAAIRTLPRRGYLFDMDVRPADFCDEPTRHCAAGNFSLPAAGVESQKFSFTFTTRSRDAIKAVSITAALALIAMAFVSHFQLANKSMRPQIDRGIAAERTIAVMPFLTLGDTPSPGLAAIVTQDVTRAVAQLTSTLVLAGPSVESIRVQQPDARDAGSALHASHVLTGSVDREGSVGRVIVRSQLQRVSDGRVVWSDRLEYRGRQGADAWLERTTLRIANALDSRLIDSHLPSGSGAGGNADAVEMVQQGYAIVRTVRTRDDVLRARALFDRALTVDPESALARQLWAHTFLQEVQRRTTSDRTGYIAIAKKGAQQVIAKHPDFAMAYYTLGSAYLAEFDLDNAARAGEKALALWPNEPRSLQLLAQVRLRQSRWDEVIPLAEQSLQINPLETNQVGWAYFYIAFAEFYKGNETEALRNARLSTTNGPNSPFAWLLQAALEALLGDDWQAHESAKHFMEIAPGQTIAQIKSEDAPARPGIAAQRARYYQGIARAGIPP